MIKTIFVLLIAIVTSVSIYAKYQFYWHCDIGDGYIHCHKKQHSIYYGKYESNEKTKDYQQHND